MEWRYCENGKNRSTCGEYKLALILLMEGVMLKTGLMVIVAMVIAYVTLQGLTISFHLLIGTRILDAAGWESGVPAPAHYVVIMSLVALAAGMLAGIAVAKIVGERAVAYALVYGAVFAGLAAWAAWDSLLTAGHLDEWILVLAPLIALPLGARLGVAKNLSP